jgi:hypothetical protein
MNPIYQWIVAHTTGKPAPRPCARCGHVQKVPRELQAATVPCSKCGAPLAPRAQA